jgi:RNA polymerase sigma factor (sigma-70 family)
MNSEDCPIRPEEYLGLVKFVVCKFHKGPKIEDSELYSAGCLALVEASKTFDPSKSKFSTWAVRVIRQRVIDEIRSFKKMPRSTGADIYDFEVMPSEGPPVEFLSSLSDPEPNESESERKSRLMLLGHCIDGKSLSELGREFGVSKECVRKRILLAADKIRSSKISIWENL